MPNPRLSLPPPTRHGLTRFPSPDPSSLDWSCPKSASIRLGMPTKAPCWALPPFWTLHLATPANPPHWMTPPRLAFRKPPTAHSPFRAQTPPLTPRPLYPPKEPIMLLRKLGSCLDSHPVTLGVKRRLGKPEAGPRPGFRFWDNRLRHFALAFRFGSGKPEAGPRPGFHSHDAYLY